MKDYPVFIPSPHQTPSEFDSVKPDTRQSGFALIISISLMAFVVLVLIALTSVTRVEVQTAAANQTALKAKQVAMLGMQIALGELQKYTGPDQRVTAPATTVYPEKDFNELYDADGDDGATSDSMWGLYRAAAQTSSGRSYLDSVETYLTPAEQDSFDTTIKDWWNNNGYHPHWTGVFDSSLRVDRATDPSDPEDLPRQQYENDPETTYGEFKRDQLPAWLVSGNELFDFDPATDTSYPVDYVTPITDIADPADSDGETVWVVGLKSATEAADSVDGLEGRIKVPTVELQDGQNTPIGRYGYWVGDESIKANFSVQTGDPDTLTTLEYRNYLQVPQRVGWERMAGFADLHETGTLDPYDPVFEKVLTHNQIGLIDSDLADDPNDRGPVPQNFHGLTSYSKSLLTDTALGGLRNDMTAYLKNRGAAINDNNFIANPTRYANNDPRFQAWNGSNTGFPADTGSIPTFGQMKNWHDQEADQNTGAITPNPDAAPMITYVNMHYGFSVDPATSYLHMHFLPQIVLWNPYDADLASATYELEIGINPYVDRLKITSETNPPGDDTTTADDGAPGRNDSFFYYNLEEIDGTSNPGQPWTDIEGNDYYPFAGDWWSGTRGGQVRDWDTGGDGKVSFIRVRYISPFTFKDTGNDLEAPNEGIEPWKNPGKRLDFTLKFNITGGFQAGQSKIFSMNNDHMDWNPANSVTMTNTFSSDNPFSLSFPILKFAGNAPTAGGGNPPTGLNEAIEWHVEGLHADSRLVPYLKLSLINGPTLSEVDHFGSLETFAVDDAANDPRVLPARSEFRVNINGVGSDLSGSAAPLGRNWIQPFTGEGSDSFADITTNFPFFSRYNMQRSFAQHPLIDNKRHPYANNNDDGFESSRLVRGQPGPAASENSIPPWDENQVDGSEAFSLITFKNTDGPFKGLSVLPIRNAKRPGSEVLSLGQFQQVNLSPFAWQPAFPIGNGEANAYVDRGAIAGIHSREVNTRIGQPGSTPAIDVWETRPNHAAFFDAEKNRNVPANTLLDISYLLNESLWDRYFLSAIPNGYGVSNIQANESLPNNRLRFTDEAVAAGAAAFTDFDTAAAHLTNLGALNVNSTSVEAWKALLTAFRNLQITGDGETNPANTVPVSRSLDPVQGRVDLTFASVDENDIGAVGSGKDYSKVVGGFRYLTDDMIQTLAERIVDEVRLRGPFYSVADFVNRRLVPPHGAGDSGSVWDEARTQSVSGNDNAGYIDASYDPFIGLQGLNGALQRAINVSGINGGVNHPQDQNEDRVYSQRIEDGSANPDPKHSIDGSVRNYLDMEHMAGAPAGEAGSLLDGAPGFVTQGDLLSMIGPALTARGDTFMIRTYGDSIDPATDKVVSKAWLEVIVQRTIDPVDPDDPSADPDDEDRWRPVSSFGRKYEVVSMRWLSENEL